MKWRRALTPILFSDFCVDAALPVLLKYPPVLDGIFNEWIQEAVDGRRKERTLA